MKQLIAIHPEMWPSIGVCVFCMNVFATKVCALLLQAFGLYAVIKAIVSESGDELSVLAVFSVIFGTVLLVSCSVRSETLSSFCHSLVLSSCASIAWICFKHSQKYQEFFSHEISILWVLKDSSKIFSKSVETLQSLVECCKVHTLIDYNVNLPKSCCKSDDFSCFNPIVRCENLQLFTVITISCIALMTVINFIKVRIKEKAFVVMTESSYEPLTKVVSNQ